MKPPSISHDQTIFLVAGGPSLKGFNFDLLEGKTVLVVNRSFEVVPNATYLFWTDFRIWRWHSDSLLAHPGLKFTLQERRYIDHPKVTNLRNTGRLGLDTVWPGIRHGNNSGAGAINLAYHLGGRRLVLLGYDMHLGPNGEQHHHPDHPIPLKAQTFNKMLPAFPPLAEALAAEGVEVLNATPGSAITCFPRVQISDIIAVR